MKKAKIQKAVLRREANALLAGWMRSNMEAGCTATYQERNGLTDEERQFIDDCIWNEINKFELRSLSPSEKAAQEIDEREPSAEEETIDYNQEFYSNFGE